MFAYYAQTYASIISSVPINLKIMHMYKGLLMYKMISKSKIERLSVWFWYYFEHYIIRWHNFDHNIILVYTIWDSGQGKGYSCRHVCRRRDCSFWTAHALNWGCKYAIYYMSDFFYVSFLRQRANWLGDEMYMHAERTKICALVQPWDGVCVPVCVWHVHGVNKFTQRLTVIDKVVSRSGNVSQTHECVVLTVSVTLMSMHKRIHKRWSVLRYWTRLPVSAFDSHAAPCFSAMFGKKSHRFYCASVLYLRWLTVKG